jgi:hypothetical protein
MVTAIDEKVPPLGPGDKLSREEFLRRWEAHPEIIRAELMPQVLKRLQEGIQSPAHHEFVAQLAANKHG